MKKNLFLTKEIIIKALFVLFMLAVLGLSFLFAENIEYALHLKYSYGENERTETEVFSSDYYVSYIDVGQGNCTFALLPNGKTMIIDGGSTMYGTRVVEFIKQRNIDTIDYLIATHADGDHIGGLTAVLDAFEVKNIYRPFQICGKGTSYSTFTTSEYEDLAPVYNYYANLLGNRTKISRVTSSVYENFLSAVYKETYQENDITKVSEVSVFYDGLSISGYGFNIEFFAPEVREEKLNLRTLCRTNGFATIGYGAGNSNNNSAIFTLDVCGNTFLFTGDAAFSAADNSKNNLEELDFVNSLTKMEQSKLSNVSVLMAGHHGSKYSTSTMLLNLTNPKYVVISVGERNTYGHPAPETLARLKDTDSLLPQNILQTRYSGTISFSGNGTEFYYSLYESTRCSKYAISWYLLGSIFVTIIIIVFVNVKFKEKYKTQIVLFTKNKTKKFK